MGPRKRRSITGLKKRSKRPAAVAKVLPSPPLEVSPQKSALSSCLQVATSTRTPKKSIDGVRTRRTDALFTLIARGCRHHASPTSLSSLPGLQAQIRYVSQTTVERKWSPFPKPAEEVIQKVLRLVERSAIGRLPGDQAKIAAQKTIKPVAKLLSKRLPRVPFPSSTKAVHFDYESLLRDNRRLKSQLAESERTIEFLRRATKEEGLATAAEMAALEALQAAEDNQNDHEQQPNEWKGVLQSNELLDSADQISLLRSESSRYSLLLDESELRKVWAKLESLGGNVYRENGVDGAQT